MFILDLYKNGKRALLRPFACLVNRKKLFSVKCISNVQTEKIYSTVVNVAVEFGSAFPAHTGIKIAFAAQRELVTDLWCIKERCAVVKTQVRLVQSKGCTSFALDVEVADRIILQTGFYRK